MDKDLTKKVLTALEEDHVRYVVFGGVALNLHGLARFTEDLDIFIAPDADNIERLKHALHSVFVDPEIDQIRADDLLGDYPAVQYVPPEGSFHIDILVRLGEAFDYSALERESEPIPFSGLQVRVVTPKMLYTMKRDTVRPKDRADAEALRRRFHLEGG